MNRHDSEIPGPDEIDATPWASRDRVALRQLPGKLAGLSLRRQVLVLAIWPFAEQLLAFLVGTVDLALAGRLSPNDVRVAAMDAIAIAGYVAWLMGLLQSAIGVGATALIARSVGGRHRRLANAALGQGMMFAVAGGFVVGISVFTGARALASLFGLGGDAATFCVTYLRIIALSAPLSAMLLVGAASLRGAGDTRNPFFAMLIVNAVNIGASILLVFGPGPIGGHGVAGIAGGTAIAWLVGAAIMLSLLISGRGGIRLHLHRLRPHWHTALRILRVGLPNAGESLGMWVINAFVVRVVAALGATGALGAHMIAVRVEAISYLPGFALGIAAATLTGQYLGLGDPVRARQAATFCWGIAFAIMTVMGVMFLLIPGHLVRIVSEAPEHHLLAPVLLMICGPVQPFFATYIVFGQAMRGAGDTRTTMLLSYPSMIVVRLGGAYLLGVQMGYGLTGVWLALCADLAIKGVLFGVRFVQGGWSKVRV